MGKYNYIPVLKSKQGEFKALNFTSILTRSKVIPLMEIVEVPWNYNLGMPAKQLKSHLDSIVENISKSWGSNLIFIDTLIKDTTFMNDGKTHHLTYLFNQLKNNGINPIPVTNTIRHNIFNNALKNIIKNTSNGYCLRLTLKEISNPNFKKDLDSILSFFKIDCSKIDLIIDLESIYKSTINTLHDELIININSFPYLATWRTFTLISGAFPKDLGGFKGNSINMVERKDWILWNDLRVGKTLNRNPSYGDYATSNPFLLEMDPRFMNPSASIKYTLENDWLIMKGNSIKTYSNSQYYNLSDDLINRPEYLGANFSEGDNTIDKCAKHMTKGPGNSGTWKYIAHNHHLELVTKQLSTLNVI